MNPVIKVLFLALMMATLFSCDQRPELFPESCEATPYDEIGPFYRPDAPIRSRVGGGYVLSGMVLSVEGCQPLPKSRLEFWLVNPAGEYDDDHRATVYADRKGRYLFESNRPTDYVGRLPHIHIMITAEGHEQLITQHYPKKEQKEAEFNLVLEPSVKVP